MAICLGLVLFAPAAEAQYIDCTGGCTATYYGLGNDPTDIPGDDETPGTVRTGTFGISRTNNDPDGLSFGACGEAERFRYGGQFRIREQDSCVVSNTNRCLIEIPGNDAESEYFNVNIGCFSLGPFGLLCAGGTNFTSAAHNVGWRMLQGTCVMDAGEECALDSDCPSGMCRSTCFSNPGTLCASHADCANDDCVTQIEWDGVGTCTDDATGPCFSDDDCPLGESCEDGIQWEVSPNSCVCCQSSLGVICPSVNFTEYPDLTCPLPTRDTINRGASDFIFEGGRETKFEPELICVPGQQEGVCFNNPHRPCGNQGDFWAGARNGKCTIPTEPCALNAFDPANPALPSTCDEEEFGGLAGDFCDLCEAGVREVSSLADGTADPSRCARWINFVGSPGELCSFSRALPVGDPQPGCLVLNFGAVGIPDLDCNQVSDRIEGRCMPVGGVFCTDPDLCPPCGEDADCASGVCINSGPLCPFISDANWFLDSNNDGRGDECQCGDAGTPTNAGSPATNDGFINALDIGFIAQCANGVIFCDYPLHDTNGDKAVNALDIGGVAQVANGAIPATSLSCIRTTDTSGE